MAKKSLLERFEAKYFKEPNAGCWSCDTPACVNPTHLRLGTLSDNSRDCVSRGRNFVPDNRGEKASWSKLTIEAVRHIKQRAMQDRKYAALYGVSRSAIQRIWEGKNWAHVQS